LCRQDANLISADVTFKFLLKELDALISPLGKELFTAIRDSIYERRTELSEVIQYLHYAFVDTDTSTHAFPKLIKHKITKSLESIANRMGLFNSKNVPQIDGITSSDTDEDKENDSRTLKETLDEAIAKQVNYAVTGEKKHRADNNSILLQKEMSLFEDEGIRGKYLQKLYGMLLTIPPTSVESERAFSTAGHICTKIRSNLFFN